MKVWLKNNKLLSLGLAASLIIISYWSLSLFTPEQFFQNEVFPTGIKFIHDDYDIVVHYERGSWWKNNQIPYKEVFSEYPQLITVLFIVPTFFSVDAISYVYIYTLFMAIFFICTVWVSGKLLQHYEQPMYYLTLLFFPAFLYFTLNRFDILAVLLVSLSVLAFVNGKNISSSLLLSAGFFIKWYPILLVPIFIAVLLNRDKKEGLKYGIIFSAVTAMVFIVSYIWFGPNIFVPYLWHVEKGVYAESIYFIIQYVLVWFNMSFVEMGLLAVALQLFSILLPGLALYHYKKISDKHLLPLTVFVILLFVFLMTGRSPQFFIWFTPLFILFIKDIKGYILLGSLDVFSYIYYPISFATIGGTKSYWLFISSVVLNLIYVSLFYYLIKSATAIKPLKE